MIREEVQRQRKILEEADRSITQKEKEIQRMI